MNQLNEKTNLANTLSGDIAMPFTSRDSATDTRTTSINKRLSVRAKLLGLVLVASLFSACSDDSINSNPPDTGGTINTTDATQQLRDEVQLFVDNVYDPILSKYCNSCHNRTFSGGASAFPFADPSAVFSYNTALTATNGSGTPLFDLANPSNSRSVTYVASGHHPWSGNMATDSAALQAAIQAWADAINNAGNTGGGGTPVDNTANLELIDKLSVPLNLTEPTAIKQLPAAGTPEYDTAKIGYGGIYTLVSQHCSRCHSDTSSTPQRPYFAGSDLTVSMQTMIDAQKIDLDNLQKSRIYVRLVTDHHNCWTNCTADGASMLSAINTFNASIADPAALPANWINTKTQNLSDGIPVSTGTPYESYMVAKYLFDDQSKAASADPLAKVAVANDTAPGGAGIPVNLYSDAKWLGGWGLEFDGVHGDSKATAQDTTSVSQRQALIDSITKYDEYSVELWVAPANVSQGEQDDPAVIFSLSTGSAADLQSDSSAQALLVGQYADQYVFYHNTGSASAAPKTLMSGATTLQATLQHVVVTYHHSTGRKIYINGQMVAEDTTVPGTMPSGWGQSGYVGQPLALTLGGRTTSSDTATSPNIYDKFQGKIRMLRVFNRAITQTEVEQNFASGVGQKFALLFKIGHLDNSGGTSTQGWHEDSYVMFTAEDFDDYSYKVYDPRFVILDAENTLSDSGSIPVEKIEIGINGKIPDAGQAYTRVKTNMDWSLQVRPLATPANSKRSISSILATTQYDFVNGVAGSGTTITTKASGTIIPKGLNVDQDQFFLKFGKLGSLTDVTVAGTVAVYDPTYDTLASSIDTNNALRNFDEIYASMVQLTKPYGTSVTVPSKADSSRSVAQLYFEDIRPALPTISDPSTFVAANQVAVARLAYEFCAQMTNGGSLMGEQIDISVADLNANGKSQRIARELGKAFLNADPASTPGNANTQTEVEAALMNHNPTNTSSDPSKFDDRDLLYKLQLPENCDPINKAACPTDGPRSKVLATAMCIATLSSATLAVH